MAMAARIDQEIAAAGDDALVLQRAYFSQSIDASAMETDNGNVWYDPATQVMTHDDRDAIAVRGCATAAEMVTKSKFALKKVDLKAGHTVGYGTKDQSSSPTLRDRRALWRRPAGSARQRSFRTVPDGPEAPCVLDQRHAARRSQDPQVSRHARPSSSATAAAARTFHPSSAWSARRRRSRSTTCRKATSRSQRLRRAPSKAGSMRGFGTLQTMSATEMLVDEAAAGTRHRRHRPASENVFRTGMKNTQGAVPIGALRNDEILRGRKRIRCGRERATRKAKLRRDQSGRRYGVGFAQVQKDYGTGGRSGDRHAGSRPRRARHAASRRTRNWPGHTTSQPIIAARILGRVPDRTFYGVVEWPEMPLTSNEQRSPCRRQPKTSSSRIRAGRRPSSRR